MSGQERRSGIKNIREITTQAEDHHSLRDEPKTIEQFSRGRMPLVRLT
jgi:hypothetical protein